MEANEVDKKIKAIRRGSREDRVDRAETRALRKKERYIIKRCKCGVLYDTVRKRSLYHAGDKKRGTPKIEVDLTYRRCQRCKVMQLDKQLRYLNKRARDNALALALKKMKKEGKASHGEYANLIEVMIW